MTAILILALLPKNLLEFTAQNMSDLEALEDLVGRKQEMLNNLPKL